MAGIKLVGFQAEVPRTAERLLPDMAAQQAENINLTSGEIRPIRPPLMVYAPSGGNLKQSAYRAVFNGEEKWVAWDNDIDVAKAPFSADVSPRYYWTGEGCPRYATFTEFGSTAFAIGLPAPTNKPSVSVSGGSGSVINRIYCVTYYHPDTGEESAPSAVSDIVSGAIDGSWTVSNLNDLPADTRDAPWRKTGLYHRLYRTAGTSASMQLVAERPVSTGSWSDNLSDAAILGDELITSDWLPPPADLKGIMSLPNGSLCGFSGNLLCYSEPYQPHAWPSVYRYGTDFPIVAIDNFGTTVVIGTSAKPVVAVGSDPSVVTLDNSIDKSWPCLSKRSMTSVGDGVIYATTNGLAYIGSTGQDLFTKNLFTKEEWWPLDPSQMFCAYAEGMVFVGYTQPGNATRLMVINPGETASLIKYNLSPSGLYVDPTTGLLYVIGYSVDRWDAGYGMRMVFNWLSKEFELPTPLNFGAAKVEFASLMSREDVAQEEANYLADITFNQSVIDSGLMMGSFNDEHFNGLMINGAHLVQPRGVERESLSITFYSRSGEIFTKNVFSADAFSLPSGYKSDILTIRLVGNVRVKSVKIAETKQGLRDL